MIKLGFGVGAQAVLRYAAGNTNHKSEFEFT